MSGSSYASTGGSSWIYPSPTSGSYTAGDSIAVSFTGHWPTATGDPSEPTVYVSMEVTWSSNLSYSRYSANYSCSPVGNNLPANTQAFDCTYPNNGDHQFITLYFKANAAGTASLHFTDPIMYSGDGKYYSQSSESDTSYTIKSAPVTCTSIPGGQSCSNGTITCDSGYTLSGTSCVQNPIQGGGGGGGTGGGGGGSGNGGGGNINGGSGNDGNGLQGSDGSDLQAPTSDTGSTDTSGNPSDQSSGSNSFISSDGSTSSGGNGSTAASTLPAIGSTPKKSGSVGMVVSIIVLLIVAGGIGFFLWRRRRNNDGMMLSELPLPPALPAAPAVPATSVYEQKINEAFYPAASHAVPGAAVITKHADEPLDMFEVAREHPETYGKVASVPLPASLEPHGVVPKIHTDHHSPKFDRPEAVDKPKPKADKPEAHTRAADKPAAKKAPVKPATTKEDDDHTLVIKH